jgi:polysaccharide biosynthesis transport protein
VQGSDKYEIVVHPTRSQGAAPRTLYLEPVDSGFSSGDKEQALVAAWRMIRQGMPWIITLLMVGAIGGLLFSIRETPIYRAHVSLEIQNPSESAVAIPMADLRDGAAAISPTSYLPTQAEILKSRTLQERTRSRIAHDRFQTASQRPGRLDWLRRLFGIEPKWTPAGAALPPVTVDVSIEPDTRIVQILCDSTNPRASATYANALANEYIDSNLQARSDAVNHARQWLSQQLDDTRAKLQTSEDQLQAYGRTSDLTFTGDKERTDQDKLKQLQEELSAAQADRIAKESAYQIAFSTPADTVPQVIDNARLNQYQVQLADLRRQLAELSSEYAPTHPKVKRVQAQIDQMEQTFKEERSNVLTRIRSEYQAALIRERLLSNAYRQQVQIVSVQTQKTVNYNILERDVETNQQLYDSLLQKAREVGIATAMRGSNVRIIDTAVPPLLPYKPNVTWNLLLGSLSGLLSGMVIVFMRESLDRTFKGPGEASVHLKVPELGVIPSGNLLTGSTYGRPPLATSPSAADAAAQGPAAGKVELVTWRDKSSGLADSFRSVLASILHSTENGAAPRIILVSSATRGEGKTTIVSNLGIALAEINQRVLLIDADIRKPRLNGVFNLTNTWGLSDVLRETSSLRDSPLEALVQRTEIPGLNVLTSGPRTNSITSLLYSNRMLELLQRLRCDFDHVLIDTPPMLQIPDARILGRLVDAAILICRAGKTDRDAALAAKRRLTDDGIPLLGTILNDWDLRNMSRYGYTSYEYYSRD